MAKETRIGNITEVRSNDDNEMVIEGYALKFDTWSENLGGFKETISRSALENTDLSDVRCLVDHVPSQIIGRTKSGTLELETDDVGLKYTVVNYRIQRLHVIYTRICVWVTSINVHSVLC